MCNHHRSRTSLVSRRIMLNDLKGELYALNMCLRLAMQNHDEAKQKSLQKRLAEI